MDRLLTSTKIGILAAILIHPVPPSHALLCRQCTSLISWGDCERATRDNLCTAQGVSASHLGWLHDNPSLLVGNHTRFACFKYVARVNRRNDKGLTTVYSRGCTFAISDFCGGWKPSVAVKACDVCSDREMCNGSETRDYSFVRWIWMLILGYGVMYRLHLQ